MVARWRLCSVCSFAATVGMVVMGSRTLKAVESSSVGGRTKKGLRIASKERVVLVTCASRRHRPGVRDYGELKAAYMYAPSIDNKARYCAKWGWDLVVGGELPEAEGRSARWNKVAWLRRVLQSYDWIVWMDLDCLFVRSDGDLLGSLDLHYDAHFTPDAGSDVPRVNSGVFVLRGKSNWTKRFLERVWAHDDFGEGLSDQNSINYVLNSLDDGERTRHVKLYTKRILNAFPSVESFRATEGYELPPDERGDETSASLVVHFAGQYGGARSTDGETPPTMLVQLLDLMLRRHERFLQSEPVDGVVAAGLRAVADARQVIHQALGALAECVAKVHAYSVQLFNELGSPYFEAASAAQRCDASDALRLVMRSLARLMLDTDDRSTSLVCTRTDANWGDKRSLATAADAAVEALRRGESIDRKHLLSSYEAAMTVILHECAYAAVAAEGVTVSDGSTELFFGANSNTRRLRQPQGEPEDVARIAVLASLPEVSSHLSQEDEVAHLWSVLAPLAIACAQSVPTDARLVVPISQANEGAWYVVDDEPWNELELFRTRPPRFVSSQFFYADEVYTCHVAQPRLTAARELGRLRQALGPSSDAVSAQQKKVIVLCGQPGGFGDCDGLIERFDQPTRALVARSDVVLGQLHQPPWRLLKQVAFFPASTVLVLAPYVPDRVSFAPLLCAKCDPGTVLLEIKNDDGSNGPNMHQRRDSLTFSQVAAHALGFHHAYFELRQNYAELADTIGTAVMSPITHDAP